MAKYRYNRSDNMVCAKCESRQIYNGWLKMNKISKNSEDRYFDASTFGATAMLEDMENKAKVKHTEIKRSVYRIENGNKKYIQKVERA